MTAMAIFQQASRKALVSNRAEGVAKWHEPASLDLSCWLRCVSPHQVRRSRRFMAVEENGCLGRPCSARRTFRASRMDTCSVSQKHANWRTSYLKSASPIVLETNTT